MLAGVPAGDERSCLCHYTSEHTGRRESTSTREALGHMGPRKGRLCDRLVGPVGNETRFQSCSSFLSFFGTLSLL